jgi:HAD superfamily hydrolase (TIGR01509 family)
VSSLPIPEVRMHSMKALIFDMDGVLVDSEPLWRLAEREVFAGVGIDLDDADCERTMGMRTDEVVRYWYGRSPWKGSSPAAVEARIETKMLELIAERAGAMPGVEHAMTIARDAGLELALASSSPPVLIDAVLRKLGYESAFAVVRSAIDEDFGKPHPAVFLTTARLLGVSPSACAVLEDSLAGVRSARAAGMRVIAVPPAHLFDEPGYDDAALKLRSLEELTAEMLE